MVCVVRGGAMVPCIFVGSALFGLDGIVWALLAAEVLSFLVCIGVYAIIRIKRALPKASVVQNA